MAVLKKILTLIALALCWAVAAHADVVDRVVAIVNDDVITLSEVNEEGKPLLKQVAETTPSGDLESALEQARQKIIEQLIEKKLMLQEAKKAQLTVSEEEIDTAFHAILERNNLTPEQFDMQLETMGLTMAQYRSNLESQVLGSKLVSREIRSKVIIPESKIIDYFDTHYTKRISQGGTYLLQIGTTWNEDPEQTGPTKQEAEQKAIRIRELAVAGQDFRNLARENSDLPSAVDGGDIGILQEKDMSAAMLQIISNTQPGEISPIIETPSGFQFFKVLSSEEGRIVTTVPYESVKDEIYEILYQEEMQDQYKKWFEQIKSSAYIQIL